MKVAGSEKNSIETGMTEELIAPCGMNCAICSGHLALIHNVKAKGIRMPYCTGCRPRGKQCSFLKKRCGLLLNKKIDYCYECEKYPCDNLQHLDKRYRRFFHMSVLENLDFIKENGTSKFLRKEKEKWKCQKCGGLICCHNGMCFSCGLDKLKTRKKLYRWEDQ
jgi:hypothetical protein